MSQLISWPTDTIPSCRRQCNLLQSQEKQRLLYFVLFIPHLSHSHFFDWIFIPPMVPFSLPQPTKRMGASDHQSLIKNFHQKAAAVSLFLLFNFSSRNKLIVKLICEEQKRISKLPTFDKSKILCSPII